jgi:hypothetical protein
MILSPRLGGTMVYDPLQARRGSTRGPRSTPRPRLRPRS